MHKIYLLSQATLKRQLNKAVAIQTVNYVFNGASSLLPITMNYLFFSWSLPCCENTIANVYCMPRKAMHFLLPPPPHPSLIFLPSLFLPKPNTQSPLQAVSILSRIENHFLSPVKVFFLKCFSSLFLGFSTATALIQCLTSFLILSVPPLLEDV